MSGSRPRRLTSFPFSHLPRATVMAPRKMPGQRPTANVILKKTHSQVAPHRNRVRSRPPVLDIVQKIYHVIILKIERFGPLKFLESFWFIVEMSEANRDMINQKDAAELAKVWQPHIRQMSGSRIFGKWLASVYAKCIQKQQWSDKKTQIGKKGQRQKTIKDQKKTIQWTRSARAKLALKKIPSL